MGTSWRWDMGLAATRWRCSAKTLAMVPVAIVVVHLFRTAISLVLSPRQPGQTIVDTTAKALHLTKDSLGSQSATSDSVPKASLGNKYTERSSKYIEELSSSSIVRNHAYNSSYWESIYRGILKWTQISKASDKNILLNLHQYSYLFSPVVCHPSPPDVLVFVQSATEHAQRRTLIRETWGGVRTVGGMTLRTMFVLGETFNSQVQNSIHEEASNFSDILQGNFLDSYLNLTLKHIMTLDWINKKCPGVKMIVKADDDTILNIYNLETFLKWRGFSSDLVYCSVYYFQGPVRDTRDKWYVNESIYPFDKYPNYCEGFGYVMSPDVARKLSEASEDTRFYWVDDVYVTGILTLKIGLKIICMGRDFSYIRGSYDTKSPVKDAMFIMTSGDFRTRWTDILESQAKT